MRASRLAGADHYLLNGTKLYITNAPVADVVLVFASHPGRSKADGHLCVPCRQGDAWA